MILNNMNLGGVTFCIRYVVISYGWRWRGYFALVRWNRENGMMN